MEHSKHGSSIVDKLTKGPVTITEKVRSDAVPRNLRLDKGKTTTNVYFIRS